MRETSASAPSEFASRVEHVRSRHYAPASRPNGPFMSSRLQADDHAALSPHRSGSGARQATPSPRAHHGRASQPRHAPRPLCGPDGNPHGARASLRPRDRRAHHRHHPGRHRRPPGALFPRHLEVRAGTRLARGLREFRRRSGALRLHLANATSSPPSAGSAPLSSRSAPG